MLAPSVEFPRVFFRCECALSFLSAICSSKRRKSQVEFACGLGNANNISSQTWRKKRKKRGKARESVWRNPGYKMLVFGRSNSTI
ncbi:MAG: hypothetical protein DBX55_03835 [Verrucomicrobia bacterium]|nr:MAG: hypothetical protein DBX55_03835 [Verrucomicrobiota bacterium]